MWDRFRVRAGTPSARRQATGPCPEMGRRRPPVRRISSRRMTSVDGREPRTFDEELLGAETPMVVTERSDAERLAEIGAEMEAGFRALAGVTCGVSLFGSARLAQDDPVCRTARETARLLGEAGFAIITGGGPGIMEAANRGARDAGALSIGLNIELAHEQAPNEHQDIELVFEHFFARKVMFVRYATGFVPGCVTTRLQPSTHCSTCPGTARWGHADRSAAGAGTAWRSRHRRCCGGACRGSCTPRSPARRRGPCPR